MEFTHTIHHLKLLADGETPLTVYSKLAQGSYSFLFESVEGGERWGRYSIIGMPASRIIKVYSHEWQEWQGQKLVSTSQINDPLEKIQNLMDSYRVDTHLLSRFAGGWVGYFGYEIIELIETKLAWAEKQNPKPNPLQVPDIILFECLNFIVFDNLDHSIELITLEPNSNSLQENTKKADQRLQQWVEKLKNTSANLSTFILNEPPQVASEFSSNTSQAEYEAMVNKIKEYTLAGDVMQVVPSQRLSIPFSHSPVSLYRMLRLLNPSPYLFFVDLAEFHIVGSSPEILVRFETGKITVRPLAGTRPRGKDAEADLAYEIDLLADPKEVAEHLMLIDLGRNDVGRLARAGSVRVTEHMMVERYSHVMHIVSNVEADALPNMRAIDVLKATFPAGTLSGAPKIRAMEIIHELEKEKRGIYGGAVGYLSFNGSMDTAIAIRTAVIKNKTLYIQAGAGVVADSDPTAEWQETINKSMALLKAAAWVEQVEK
ncbi:MAG: anthranilate synthase component I [Pseudomonadota bacterium]